MDWGLSPHQFFNVFGSMEPHLHVEMNSYGGSGVDNMGDETVASGAGSAVPVG